MKGSCHCGAVELEVAAAPSEVAECNCSLCRRVGGLWAYYHPDEVRIVSRPDSMIRYVQGDRTLATCHCGTCGCTTHWEPLPGSGAATGEVRPLMGVNARLLDGVDKNRVRVRQVDGASF